MRILHTSDWHIGRSLYGRRRYDEHRSFLDWLLQKIEEEKIDTVIVAGDIFDNGAPSNRAQRLYYNFLRDASRLCRHIVITAGNHDSPSFLSAPKEILMALNVNVVGSITKEIDDEIIILKDEQSNPEAIVCAVPYLRDRDVRKGISGETYEEKDQNLLCAIEEHYRSVCDRAQSLSESMGSIPIIATGHLFTTGGTVGEGERELYVGSLSRVNCDRLPSSIDYLALGHLHVPQIVGGKSHIRYSGSPIPMGFKEAKQRKIVLKVTFDGRTPSVEDITIPTFQELVRIEGDMDQIEGSIESLKTSSSDAWLEIDYRGKSIVPDLRGAIESLVEGTSLEVCRIQNSAALDRTLDQSTPDETLDDLTPDEVFRRCLDSFEVPEGEREELQSSYREIVRDLQEEDRREL